MKLRLEEDGASIPQGVLLVAMDAQGYAEGVAGLARRLTKEGRGVYVTANRPVRQLRATLEEGGVETDRLFFIDCVTSMTGILAPPGPDVLHIESPSMLEKIALRAEQVLRRTEGPAFLMVDSLSTLAMYNGAAAVTEFAHTLITRMRLQRVTTVLLMVDERSEAGLRGTMEALCDHTWSA